METKKEPKLADQEDEITRLKDELELAHRVLDEHTSGLGAGFKLERRIREELERRKPAASAAVALSAKEEEIAALRQRDKVISRQLERVAAGFDPLTADLRTRLDAAAVALSALQRENAECLALVEKWREQARRHKTHGDSYRVGQGWGMEQCAEELKELLARMDSKADAGR